MRYIHPFPARMAPEIALEKIQGLRTGQTVLDPMSGSGMVLAQAAKYGIKSIGYDLDPLARMISKVGTTRVNEEEVFHALSILLELCHRPLSGQAGLELPWIDDDPETCNFIDFWFGPEQIRQLRTLSYHLVSEPFFPDDDVIQILRTAVSRLIITKEPKASLARDTAHSRPHRTVVDNSFDVIAELETSVAHVLRALDSSKIKCAGDSYLGDARKMIQLKSNSVDSIITSPPYLNAIDYMRGHRLSLVWLGYSLKELRAVRSSAIGAEKISRGNEMDHPIQAALGNDVLEKTGPRTFGMLKGYFSDLKLQTAEAFRVLKVGASATYVIGNSNIKGYYIKNSELLKAAAVDAGFSISKEETRDIPDARRYMPMPKDSSAFLGARMRTEHVIEFLRP